MVRSKAPITSIIKEFYSFLTFTAASASSKKHHIIPAVMSMHTPTVWAKMTTVSHSILEDS